MPNACVSDESQVDKYATVSVPAEHLQRCVSLAVGECGANRSLRAQSLRKPILPVDVAARRYPANLPGLLEQVS